MGNKQTNGLEGNSISLLDHPETHRQLLILLEQCSKETKAAKVAMKKNKDESNLSCDTSTAAENSGASSPDASGLSPRLNCGAYDSVIADSKAAHDQDETRRLRAELNRLMSVLSGSTECMKYWVDEAAKSQADSDRFLSQLSVSVPIEAVRNGTAECVKPWIEKVDAARAESNRLSSQLSASVPIKCVLDGSAECMKPWLQMSDAAASLTRRLQDQVANIQDLEADKNRLQSNLDSKEKELKYAHEQVRNLQKRLEVEQKSSRQIEALREQAQSAKLQLAEAAAKLAEANETIDGLTVRNHSLQQSNADLRVNCNRLKQSVGNERRSDQPEDTTRTPVEAIQDKLLEANETVRQLEQQIRLLQQDNAALQRSCSNWRPVPPPPAMKYKKGWVPARYTQTTLSLLSAAISTESAEFRPAESTIQVGDMSCLEKLTQAQQALEEAHRTNDILRDRNRALYFKLSGNSGVDGEEHYEHTTQSEQKGTGVNPITAASLIKKMQLLEEKEKSLREADNQIAEKDKQIDDLKAEIRQQTRETDNLGNFIQEIHDHIARLEDQASRTSDLDVDHAKVLIRICRQLANLRALISEF